MSEYTIIKTNAEDYDRLVLCLSFESLLTYIKKIESTLAKDNIEEEILIDQLLITGDGTNRFMSCKFAQGKLDIRTAKTVKPNACYRRETVAWLHNNYCYVEHSILTEEQRQKIKRNIVF
ncbi:MAG: type II toxin-antitoxin system RnlB family antitoxin [Lachnospiraceae bacterium]|nr:type II toxin-antitoxin system RnlB family antitoxin [Lachnospiraceae bacterium]